jgi:hypothetical protein
MPTVMLKAIPLVVAFLVTVIRAVTTKTTPFLLYVQFVLHLRWYIKQQN